MNNGFILDLTDFFATVASKNTTRFKSVQKCPEKNHRAMITMFQSKSLTYIKYLIKLTELNYRAPNNDTYVDHQNQDQNFKLCFSPCVFRVALYFKKFISNFPQF